MYVPYNSMTMVLTLDPVERDSLTAYSKFF